MSRSIRVEYEGAWYHVMARGNRREAIFLTDDDREIFLQTLGEACEMTGWEVHAWVLMDNHYHMVIRTPEPNLIAGMKWLQNTFTRRFNTKYRQWGRLFGDRYKAVLVEGSEDNHFYLETVLDYVHLNPVRAGLVAVEKGQSVLDFRWSSLARGYGIVPKRRPKWQYCEEGLCAFGWQDNVVGRRRMIEHLNARAVAEQRENCGVSELPMKRDGRLSKLRRGWYWGSQDFGERMLTLVGKGLLKARARGYRSAWEVKEHGEHAAEQLFRETLAAMKTDEKSIKEWPRGDERKLALAILLRKRTTVPGKWIADRLKMGSSANVSQRVRTARPEQLAIRLPPVLRSMMKNI